MSKQDYVKQYGFLILNILLIGYCVYVFWFLYQSIYTPLVIANTPIVATTKYRLPEKELEQIQNSLNEKTNAEYDSSIIPNPFNPVLINNNTITDTTTNVNPDIDAFGTPTTENN